MFQRLSRATLAACALGVSLAATGTAIAQAPAPAACDAFPYVKFAPTCAQHSTGAATAAAIRLVLTDDAASGLPSGASHILPQRVVAASGLIRFRVVNDGSAAHRLTIGHGATGTIAPGQSRVITLRMAPGRYVVHEGTTRYSEVLVR